MGQKVSPVGLRIGIIKDWKSKWYANKKDYPKFLYEDMKIRDFLFKKLPNNTVGSIEIERNNKNINVKIYTFKPGQIIGRGGSDIDKLRLLLKKQINKEIYIDVIEIKKQFLSAKLVARNIAEQIEKRVSFRIAQKRAISSVMKSGAKGIKTAVSGRLGGADMARTEGYTEGNVPLHTLRADIDYAHEEADTTYGKIGVKVWIYTKEVLNKKKNNNRTLK